MSNNFKYEIRIGGLTFKGNTDEEILGAIDTYYKNKQIAIDINEYKAIVKKGKREIVVKLHNQGENITVAEKTFSFSKVVSGAKALIKSITGFNVPQSEVNRRAIICTNCPLVRDTTECKACGFGKTLAQWSEKTKVAIGKPNLIIPNGLDDKYCKHCGCSLFLMLSSEMNNFSEPNATSRPNYCWANPNSPNYVQN